MRRLIDTRALIWFCEGNPLLEDTTRATEKNETNQAFSRHLVPHTNSETFPNLPATHDKITS